MKLNRRSFCAMLSSLFAVPASIFAAERKSKLLIQYAESGEIAYVDGSTKDKLRFFDEWQTKLWPDWRTNENNAARKVRDVYESHVSKGFSGCFYIGRLSGDLHSDAFKFAIDNCGVKCVIRDSRKKTD